MKNIILLNGPSLPRSKVTRGPQDRVFAINRKSQIEKIFGNVNYWALCSPPEMLDMIEDVYEFLGRSERNRLITSIRCLSWVKDVISIRPLPNPERIILIDEIGHEMEKGFYLSAWNTVSVLFYILATVEPKTPIFVYGMDGMGNTDKKGVFFNESELSEKRLRESQIFEDMLFLEANFWVLMGRKKLHPKIFNMNRDSFYKCFKFADETFENQDEGNTFFFHHQFTNKELLNKLDLLATNAALNQRFDQILKKLKKPSWFKRIIKKLT